MTIAARARRDGDRAEHRLADPQRTTRRRRLHAHGDAARRRVDGARDVDHLPTPSGSPLCDCPALSVDLRARTNARRIGRRDVQQDVERASDRRSRRAAATGSTDAPSVADIRVTTPLIGDWRIDRFCRAPRGHEIGARLRRDRRRPARHPFAERCPPSRDAAAARSLARAASNAASALCERRTGTAPDRARSSDSPGAHRLARA